MNVNQLAEKVAEALSCPLFKKCKVWGEGREKRVYVGKYGYVSIDQFGVSQNRVTYYNSVVSELLGDLADAIPTSDEQGEQREGLILLHGVGEVLDAEADVAREDWDI